MHEYEKGSSRQSLPIPIWRIGIGAILIFNLNDVCLLTYIRKGNH